MTHPRHKAETKKKIMLTKQKVQPTIVSDIRKDFEGGMKRVELVEKYKLNPTTISNICHGHTYTY